MVDMALENEGGGEGPMDLLRELVEESGKWTEELVVFSRQLLVVLVILAVWFSYIYSGLVLKLLSGGPVSVFPTLLGAAIAVYIVYGLIRLRRIYKNRVVRREKWRRRFEILRQKEEEIEKLLSGEEAG